MFFLFASAYSFGQLSISPSHPGENNYLFANGALLYVQGPIDLRPNTGSDPEASIYLREEAQLIQGEAGPSGNTGSGMLSIFQEGTSNAFDYNYWSSPVGSEGSGNGLFGIRMLYAPLDLLHSRRAENTGHLDGLATPLTISNKWIYTYSGLGYSDWTYIGHSTAIAAGFGFSMKGVNGTDATVISGRANNPGSSQRYDFRGKPNSGLIPISVSEGAAVLVGNPYPSALDLSLFLWEHSGSGSYSGTCYQTFNRKNVITGIAYFWDSLEDGKSHYLADYIGGYGAFSPVDPCTKGIYARPVFRTHDGENRQAGMGAHFDRRFTPVAQGFMIEAVTSGTVEFKNTHRIFYKEGANSQFKSAAKAEKQSGQNSRELIVIPKIILNIDFNDHYTRELILGFWPSATEGTDPAMDAPAFNVAATDAGWLQNDRPYVIDIRNRDPFQKIPFFLKVENHTANIRFSLAATENLQYQNFYIFDEESGEYHDLEEKDLEIALKPGNYHQRFKFALSKKKELTPIVHEKDSRISIFQNNYMKELEIVNNSAAAVKGVEIYDLQGKKIFRRHRFENPAFIQIGTSSWANGIYILKLTTSDELKITRKITILN